MTHSIGAGTVNVTINMSEGEASLLGKMACARDMARGALIRELMVLGLARVDHATAAQVRQIRRARRAGALLLLFAAFLAGGDRQAIRRASARVRVPRVEEVAA